MATNRHFYSCHLDPCTIDFSQWEKNKSIDIQGATTNPPFSSGTISVISIGEITPVGAIPTHYTAYFIHNNKLYYNAIIGDSLFSQFDKYFWPSPFFSKEPILVSSEEWKYIDANNGYALAISNSGSLYGWGTATEYLMEEKNIKHQIFNPRLYLDCSVKSISPFLMGLLSDYNFELGHYWPYDPSAEDNIGKLDIVIRKSEDTDPGSGLNIEPIFNYHMHPDMPVTGVDIFISGFGSIDNTDIYLSTTSGTIVDQPKFRTTTNYFITDYYLQSFGNNYTTGKAIINHNDNIYVCDLIINSGNIINIILPEYIHNIPSRSVPTIKILGDGYGAEAILFWISHISGEISTISKTDHSFRLSNPNDVQLTIKNNYDTESNNLYNFPILQSIFGILDGWIIHNSGSGYTSKHDNPLRVEVYDQDSYIIGFYEILLASGSIDTAYQPDSYYTALSSGSSYGLGLTSISVLNIPSGIDVTIDTDRAVTVSDQDSLKIFTVESGATYINMEVHTIGLPMEGTDPIEIWNDNSRSWWSSEHISNVGDFGIINNRIVHESLDILYTINQGAMQTYSIDIEKKYGDTFSGSGINYITETQSGRLIGARFPGDVPSDTNRGEFTSLTPLSRSFTRKLLNSQPTIPLLVVDNAVEQELNPNCDILYKIYDGGLLELDVSFDITSSGSYINIDIISQSNKYTYEPNVLISTTPVAPKLIHASTDWTKVVASQGFALGIRGGEFYQWGPYNRLPKLFDINGITDIVTSAEEKAPSKGSVAQLYFGDNRRATITGVPCSGRFVTEGLEVKSSFYDTSRENLQRAAEIILNDDYNIYNIDNNTTIIPGDCSSWMVRNSDGTYFVNDFSPTPSATFSIDFDRITPTIIGSGGNDTLGTSYETVYVQLQPQDIFRYNDIGYVETIDHKLWNSVSQSVSSASQPLKYIEKDNGDPPPFVAFSGSILRTHCTGSPLEASNGDDIFDTIFDYSSTGCCSKPVNRSTDANVELEGAYVTIGDGPRRMNKLTIENPGSGYGLLVNLSSGIGVPETFYTDRLPPLNDQNQCCYFYLKLVPLDDIYGYSCTKTYTLRSGEPYEYNPRTHSVGEFCGVYPICSGKPAYLYYSLDNNSLVDNSGILRSSLPRRDCGGFSAANVYASKYVYYDNGERFVFPDPLPVPTVVNSPPYVIFTSSSITSEATDGSFKWEAIMKPGFINLIATNPIPGIPPLFDGGLPARDTIPGTTTDMEIYTIVGWKLTDHPKTVNYLNRETCTYEEDWETPKTFRITGANALVMTNVTNISADRGGPWPGVVGTTDSLGVRFFPVEYEMYQFEYGSIEITDPKDICGGVPSFVPYHVSSEILYDDRIITIPIAHLAESFSYDKFPIEQRELFVGLDGLEIDPDTGAIKNLFLADYGEYAVSNSPRRYKVQQWNVCDHGEAVLVNESAIIALKDISYAAVTDNDAPTNFSHHPIKKNIAKFYLDYTEYEIHGHAITFSTDQSIVISDELGNAQPNFIVDNLSISGYDNLNMAGIPSIYVSSGLLPSVSKLTGIINGKVSGVAIEKGGSGFFDSPTVHINGLQTPISSGVLDDESFETVAAAADAIIEGEIIEIKILDPGSNYISSPQIIFDGIGISPIISEIKLDSQGGISNIKMSYRGKYRKLPSITLTNEVFKDNNGRSAILEPVLDGSVIYIKIIESGNFYQYPPDIVIDTTNNYKISTLYDELQNGTITRKQYDDNPNTATAQTIINGRLCEIQIEQPYVHKYDNQVISDSYSTTENRTIPKLPIHINYESDFMYMGFVDLFHKDCRIKRYWNDFVQERTLRTDSIIKTNPTDSGLFNFTNTDYFHRCPAISVKEGGLRIMPKKLKNLRKTGEFPHRLIVQNRKFDDLYLIGNTKPQFVQDSGKFIKTSDYHANIYNIFIDNTILNDFFIDIHTQYNINYLNKFTIFLKDIRWVSSENLFEIQDVKGEGLSINTTLNNNDQIESLSLVGNEDPEQSYTESATIRLTNDAQTICELPIISGTIDTMKNSGIYTLSIINSGYIYKLQDNLKITINHNTGKNFAFKIITTNNSFSINDIIITNPGKGYTHFPEITFTVSNSRYDTELIDLLNHKLIKNSAHSASGFIRYEALSLEYQLSSSRPNYNGIYLVNEEIPNETIFSPSPGAGGFPTFRPNTNSEYGINDFNKYCYRHDGITAVEIQYNTNLMYNFSVDDNEDISYNIETLPALKVISSITNIPLASPEDTLGYDKSTMDLQLAFISGGSGYLRYNYNTLYNF